MKIYKARIIPVLLLLLVFSAIILGIKYPTNAQGQDLITESAKVKIKNNVKEKITKIFGSISIDIEHMNIKETLDYDHYSPTITMLNETIEVISNENDTIFTLTDVEARKIKLSKNDASQDYLNQENILKSKIDAYSNYAYQVANILDSCDKTLTETNYLQDDTIAYKWNRVYNNYIFETDFILVILDAKNGKLVQVSKRLTSDTPMNLNNLIDVTDAINYSKSILEKYNFKNITYQGKELKIVNPLTSSNNLELNKNTVLAYCLAFNFDINSKHGTLIVQIDAQTGKLIKIV